MTEEEIEREFSLRTDEPDVDDEKGEENEESLTVVHQHNTPAPPQLE